MIKHRLGELRKSFAGCVDPQNAEQLKRTKTGATHSFI